MENCKLGNTNCATKNGGVETFLFSAIQNLANNISASFNMMNIHLNQLESNLEETISANIETALKTHIEKEVGKVKQELKDDMVTMNLKIDNVQKSCENLILEKKDENSIDIRNNVIIKNLAYDEREKDNAEVTMNKRNTHTIDETTANSRKSRVNNIPDNFLLDNAIRDRINETINRIENAINVENNVQSAFDEFCVLLKDEMDNKLPKMKPKPDFNRYGKSRYKPYWNDYLQNQWKKVCSLKKIQVPVFMKEKSKSQLLLRKENI
ncbi:unnamed protein product [Mytilus edulis]|uniref:Uncharacterized protein n=1 Tax=Mytilus edulis TaxID=6550 RepID=A0A8S3SRZ1_MYTED|nr:unnamed protein product [Mytilus edulis]